MTDTLCMPPKIAAALLKAQQAAKPVEKLARNDFHKYNYASAEGIMAEGKEALNANGLALITKGWRIVEYGQLGPHAEITYQLLHESGEGVLFDPVPTPIIPDKGRPLDKALATALTYSLGYFLRGLLNMPRVDHTEDADQRDDREHDRPKKQTRKPPEETERTAAGTEDMIQYQDEMAKWRDYLPTLKTAADHTNAVANLKELHQPAKDHQRKLLAAQAKKLGLTWDADNHCFVDAAKEEAVA